MNTGKLKAVVFIIVFLLLLAAVVSWAMGQDEKRREAREAEEAAAAAAAAAAAEAEAEPQQPQETPAEQPQGFVEMPEGYKPAPTPAPAGASAPTPAPQQQQQQQQQPQQQQQQPQQEEYVQPPAPTPAPENTLPAGQALGSDSFRSDTGTGLNLICDWSAVSVEGNQAKVTVTISAESFSLYLYDMGNNVFVNVGGQNGSLAQPQMQHDGGYTVTTFGTLEFTLPLAEGSNDFPVAVEWHYNGSYSGVDLPVIECGGTITLTR